MNLSVLVPPVPVTFSPSVNRQGPAYMDSVCACLDLNFSTPPVDLDALVRLKGPTTILVIITITIRRPGSSQRSAARLMAAQDRTRGRPPRGSRLDARSPCRQESGQVRNPKCQSLPMWRTDGCTSVSIHIGANRIICKSPEAAGTLDFFNLDHYP